MSSLGRICKEVLAVSLLPVLSRLTEMLINSVSDLESDDNSESDTAQASPDGVQRVLYAMTAYNYIDTFIMDHPQHAENKHLLTALQLAGNVVIASDKRDVEIADRIMRS